VEQSVLQDVGARSMCAECGVVVLFGCVLLVDEGDEGREDLITVELHAS